METFYSPSGPGSSQVTGLSAAPGATALEVLIAQLCI